MYQVQEERPLSELFSELSREMNVLVRQEVQLAKTEMSEKASDAGKQAGIAGFGGALAYVGLFAIVAAVIILLGQFIPLWLSALIVGVILAVVGIVMVRQGARNLKDMDMAPKKTVQSIQENKQWLQSKLS